MITRTLAAGAVTVVGNMPEAPGSLQPDIKVIRDIGGTRVILVYEGDWNALATYQASTACVPGYTSLPAGVTAADGLDIKLISSELDGDVGFTGRLVNTYVERNARETTTDMAAGLVSRQIGIRWIERQEAIEMYAARMTDTELGVFNSTLLEMWRNEEAADVKADFKVRLFTEDDSGNPVYEKTVALDNDDADIPASLKGSLLTKAIAQRIAQGVEYAGRQNIQVVVDETWRVAPTLAYQCNEIIGGSLPENHRPLFSMPTPAGTSITWMRLSDTCEPADNAYNRTIAYLGIPNTQIPNPVPEGWGDTPFDALLYTIQSGGE